MAVVPTALYRHPSKPLTASRLRFYLHCRNTLYVYGLYKRAMFSRANRAVYLPYKGLRYLASAPTASPSYLKKLWSAAVAAYRGKLIPWSLEQAGDIDALMGQLPILSNSIQAATDQPPAS